MSEINVYKNRTNTIQFDLQQDVSLDTFISEIREKANVESALIATWNVAFVTDGTDGLLVLTIDDSSLTNVIQKSGYMDLIRVTGGEPIPAIAEPIKVSLKDTVTEWTP